MLTARRSSAFGAGLLVLALAAGCGDDDSSPASPAAEAPAATTAPPYKAAPPATTAPQATTAPAATTAPPTTTTPPATAGSEAGTRPAVAPATDRRRARLTGGSVRRRKGFVPIEFRFRGGLPGYDVRYVDGPVRQDGSGDVVDVKGSHVLLVRMENAIDTLASGGPSLSDAPEAVRSPAGEVGPVADILRVGGFEGIVTYAIGLTGKVPFRVRTARNPQRLIIDVAG